MTFTAITLSQPFHLDFMPCPSPKSLEIKAALETMEKVDPVGPRTLHRLKFEGLVFDLDSGRLSRNACEIALKPKVSAMLVHFLENPHRLVSKANLLTAVWGETRVSDETLRSTLRGLRQRLDDDARSPRFIETVHGRGYRFIATLHHQERDTTEPLLQQLAKSLRALSTQGVSRELTSAVQHCLTLLERESSLCNTSPRTG